jgi:thiamine biosynthesis protein ThiI
MFSGGLDSPVAMKLAKRRFEVTPIHFMPSEFYPLDYKERLVEILKAVKEKVGFEELIVVPFSNVLRKISENVNRKYRCVICRKSMLIACDILCDELGFDAIGTGEAIGQKASQTIYNIAASHYGIRHPIVHPLLCLDKEEINKLAEKYGLKFEKHVGTCLLVPRYPITKAKISVVEKMLLQSGVLEEIENSLENFARIKDPEELMEYEG